MKTTWKILTPLLLVSLLTAACGKSSTTAATTTTAAGGDGKPTAPVTLQLGYFPNITHAPGIVGDRKGLFQKALGDKVTIKVSSYNAGPEAVDALFAEALDITFIGPNPAINAYAKSSGAAIRIIGGSTSGGAALVVKPTITKPADLKGKKIATPQLGNTQDVALRAWLKEQGFATDQAGGGDVSVLPQANADTLTAFIGGSIDGAWVPEPWATRLVQEGKGVVLVNEADLWPGGQFVTTHLVVRQEFLEEHPQTVRALLEGLVAATELVATKSPEVQGVVNGQIEKDTGKALKPEILTSAFANLTPTLDPVASSLAESARDAQEAGLLRKAEIDGIYDLGLLNALLEAAGKPPVSDAGLGVS
jgi:NitT/TauT family transport system substrate-binding protein